MMPLTTQLVIIVVETDKPFFLVQEKSTMVMQKFVECDYLAVGLLKMI